MWSARSGYVFARSFRTISWMRTSPRVLKSWAKLPAAPSVSFSYENDNKYIWKNPPLLFTDQKLQISISGLTWTNSLKRSVSFLQALATWAAFSDANARRSINLFILTRLFPVRLPPLDGVARVKLDPDIPSWKSPSFDWHARYSQ